MGRSELDIARPLQSGDRSCKLFHLPPPRYQGERREAICGRLRLPGLLQLSGF